MSTKVYTAYKMKKSSDLWSLVRDIKLKAVANIKAELTELYAVMSSSIDGTTEEFKEKLKHYTAYELSDADWRARHNQTYLKIRNEYRNQLISNERNHFNFDVSVGIWEHKGKMYLIPYADCLMRNVLDFLKEDSRLEDYCYWNNTDEPEEIPAKIWKARGKVWDAIDAAGWQNHLVIDICSWSNYYQIDPYLEIHKAKMETTLV